MQTNDCDLQKLAFRASRGDSLAGADFQRRLEPQLQRIVRCTLRYGITNNPLAKRVLAEAGKVVTDPCHPDNEVPEQIIVQVTRRLCATVMEKISRTTQPEAWAVETVSNI